MQIYRKKSICANFAPCFFVIRNIFREFFGIETAAEILNKHKIPRGEHHRVFFFVYLRSVAGVQRARKSSCDLIAGVQRARKSSGDPIAGVQRARKSSGDLIAGVQRARKSSGDPIAGVQRARKSSGDPITGVQRKNINTNKNFNHYGKSNTIEFLLVGRINQPASRRNDTANL